MSCRVCLVSVLAILGLAAAGCGDDDGAPVRTDSGVIRADAGITPRPDGMVPMIDAGSTPAVDAGTVPRTDGGVVPRSDGGGGPTVPGSTGAACTMPSDCTMLTSAMCLTDIGGFYSFPGGYCTTSCMSDAECGAGGGCLMIPVLGGYCVKSCTAASDCREGEGYTCMAPPIGGMGGMYCLPPFMMGGLSLDGGLPIP